MARDATVAVGVIVTFLRMERPPAASPRPLPEGVRIERIAPCPVPLYRQLYEGVGRDWVWWLRRTLSDEDLSLLLADPRVSIHVLYRGDEIAGFFELDRRRAPDCNLSYFGLMPSAIGHGLGRPLLDHAIAEAWRGGTRAVTVNTCTADHPRALPNYIAAGFRRIRDVPETWDVPLSLGLPIPDRLRV